MDQDTLERIRNWVDIAEPAITGLANEMGNNPNQPMPAAAAAFNAAMAAAPAINPRHILDLVPLDTRVVGDDGVEQPVANHASRHFVLGWLLEEEGIQGPASYYHVTEAADGRGRFRLIPPGVLDGDQLVMHNAQFLRVLGIVLRSARWITANPGNVVNPDNAAPADGGLGFFPGAAAAMAAHNGAMDVEPVAPADDDDGVVPMDVDPDGVNVSGGRRSRRNRTQKRKKSRYSRKRRTTKGVKRRKKSARHSTRRRGKKRRMTRKSK